MAVAAAQTALCQGLSACRCVMGTSTSAWDVSHLACFQAVSCRAEYQTIPQTICNSFSLTDIIWITSYTHQTWTMSPNRSPYKNIDTPHLLSYILLLFHRQMKHRKWMCYTSTNRFHRSTKNDFWRKLSSPWQAQLAFQRPRPHLLRNDLRPTGSRNSCRWSVTKPCLAVWIREWFRWRCERTH